MAFTNSNDYLSGRSPAVFPAGAEVVAVRFPLALVAADLDANDAGSLGILPAGCVPVGLTIDSDDLDTNGTPTLVASVGFINAADTDLDGAAWATGITACQTGASAPVALSTAAMRMPATQADRRFGIKFTAGAATKAAGQVGLTLMYRAV
jgi:hypothetical protein